MRDLGTRIWLHQEPSLRSLGARGPSGLTSPPLPELGSFFSVVAFGFSALACLQVPKRPYQVLSVPAPEFKC